MVGVIREGSQRPGLTRGCATTAGGGEILMSARQPALGAVQALNHRSGRWQRFHSQIPSFFASFSSSDRCSAGELLGHFMFRLNDIPKETLFKFAESIVLPKSLFGEQG